MVSRFDTTSFIRCNEIIFIRVVFNFLTENFIVKNTVSETKIISFYEKLFEKNQLNGVLGKMSISLVFIEFQTISQVELTNTSSVENEIS